VLLSLLPTKVANTLIIFKNDQINYLLPELQDRKLLMDHRHSFLRDSSNVITTIFAHKAGQYFHYASQRPRLLLIN